MADTTANQFQTDVNDASGWVNGGESHTQNFRLGQSADSPAKTIAGINARADVEINNLATSFNLSPAGFDFATGGTITSNAQTIADASNNEWIYTLDIPSGGFVVAPGTVPSPPTYKQVSYSEASNVSFSESGNVEIALRDRAPYMTISEARASALNVDQYVRLTDRGGLWIVRGAGLIADGFSIISLPSGGALEYVIEDNVQAKHLGVIGNGVNDDSDAYQASVVLAQSNKSDLWLPNNSIIRITKTITYIDGISFNVRGHGEFNTQITHEPASSNTVMHELHPRNSRVRFFSIHFRCDDEFKGLGICARSRDNRPDLDGIANFQNGFFYCRISDFNIGWEISGGDPSDGNTMAFCSEFMMFHSRVRNCRTFLLQRNIQAVDFTMVATDVENDDDGEEYTFIRDEVGGEYKIYGGSFVGKGLLFDGVQSGSSTSLWQASKLVFSESRFELRGGHVGNLVRLPQSAFQTEALVQFDSCQFLCFTQDLNILEYAGKVSVIVNNCNTLSGTLTVRESPTLNISASFSGSTGWQSLGSVSIKDSPNIFYEKRIDSAFGTYNESATAPVTIENRVGQAAGNVVIDAQGWQSLRSPTVQQRGAGMTFGLERPILYNVDSPNSGFSSARIKVPYLATPTKFVLFRHPSNRGVAQEVKLYLVKDNADWANSSTFDKATDAIEIATTGALTSRTGYMEFEINFTDAYLTGVGAGYFQSGLGNWEEGRLFIEANTGSWSGFAGVKVI